MGKNHVHVGYWKWREDELVGGERSGMDEFHYRTDITLLIFDAVMHETFETRLYGRVMIK